MPMQLLSCEQQQFAIVSPYFLRSENSQIRKHFSITEEQFWNGSVVKVSSEGATVMTLKLIQPACNPISNVKRQPNHMREGDS